MARIKRTHYMAVSFGAVTLGVIFVLLYQNNRYIAQLYAFQALEREQAALEAQLERLLQRRAQIQSREAIATYALEQLQLQPIRLQSVHAIADLS